MCILIIAKRKEIHIEFACESIIPAKDGLMNIVVDLLVTNKNHDSISELLCFVPQQLFYLPSTQKPRKYKDTSLYEDITYDIVTKNSKYNSHILEQQYDFEHIEDKPHHYRIWLELADPTDTRKTISYEGFFESENKIEPYNGIGKEGQAILNNLKISILSIKLQEPMIPQRSRWFRLKFLTLSGPLEISRRSQYQYLRLLNKLYYNYDIRGPGKLKDHIKKILHSYGNTLEKKAETLINNEESAKLKYQELRSAYSLLYKIIIEENLDREDTKTVINDWRTRFFHGNLEPPKDSPNGEIIPIGLLPNHLPNQSQAYSEWRSGIINIEGSKGDGYFSIQLSTRYIPGLHAWLPIIAIILSLISIICTILY